MATSLASLKTGLYHWRSLATDSSLALVMKGMSLPLSCLAPLVIARLYGAEKLGAYTLAVYLITTLSVVCRLGLDTGMLRFGAALRGSGETDGVPGLFRRALVLVLALSGAAALGVYLAGDWLARVFQAPALTALLPLTALALPIMAAGVLSGETLRSLGGSRWVVFQQDLLTPLALLGLVVALSSTTFAGDGGMWALGLAFLLSSVLGLMFLWIKLRGPLKNHPGKATPAPLRDLWRYSWPLYLSALLMLVFGVMDCLVLGLFTGPAPVAFYEAASRSALLVSLPLFAVNAVAPPLFAQLHQGDRLEELEGMARATSRWMYYAALPLALGVAALAPEILGLFGQGFQEAQGALRILVAAQLVNVACGSVGFLLAMTGHQRTLTLTLAAGGGLGIPLMTAGAAFSGITGLALAKGLWLVGVNVLMTLGVWRRLRLQVWARGVGWATLGGLLGLVLFWLVRPFMGPWGAAVLGTLGYLACISKILYQEVTGLMMPVP